MSKPNTGGGVRRLVATAGVIALGLIGVVAFATPASATVTVPSVGNVPDGPYTLNIHKYEQPNPALDLPNNGTEQTIPNTVTPLQGVKYSVQLVTGNNSAHSLDLTTSDGWQHTQGLTASAVLADPANYTVAAGTSGVTDVNGLVTFNPALGVYMVTETDAGGNNITNLAPPFLVTVPFPNANNWLTTVNVYPKNTVANAPTKTVDDSAGYGLGSAVNWTIDATVPNLSQGNSLTSFIVKDALDSRLSAPAEGDVVVSFAGAALVSTDYAVDVTGQNVTVTFTTDGLTKLAAHQGSDVSVMIPTTVTSIGSGTIPNTGVVNINGKDYSSTPVKTTWGALKIVKVADGTQAPLKGAEFAVYTSAAHALAGTGAVATGTSDANGEITINGLRAQNNGAGNNLDYFIVETVAPSGYTVNPAYTPANPTMVTIAPGSIAEAQVKTVTDSQVLPFMLPLTGSTGTTLFIGGGIALIALAMGAAFVMYRRKAGVAQV